MLFDALFLQLLRLRIVGIIQRRDVVFESGFQVRKPCLHALDGLLRTPHITSFLADAPGFAHCGTHT